MIVIIGLQLLDMHCGQETGLVNESKGEYFRIILLWFLRNVSHNICSLEFLEGLFGKQSGNKGKPPLNTQHSVEKYKYKKKAEKRQKPKHNTIHVIHKYKYN